MKLKRALALLLACTLATSIFAGCSTSSQGGTSGAASQTPSSTDSKDTGSITFPLEKPVTMTMLAIENSGVKLADTGDFKYIEQQTNVKWDVQSVMGADLAEKRNLLLASNDYPDVFYKTGLSQADVDKYGAQGTFIPLDDLISKYAPNLKKLLGERDGVLKQITSPDGKIYSLPEIDNPSPALPVYFINQKWLKKLGLNEPTNLDELYNVFKAFKEKDPNGNGKADEIPFTTSTTNTPYFLLPYFGFNMDITSMTDITKDGKLEYMPTSDKYKEFLAYLKKLYSEGLLDKNGLTQTLEQQVALGAQGDILGSFFDAGAFLTVGRTRDTDFKEVTPFVSGVNPTSTGAVTGTFAITDTCKNPEIAMAWVDQFYSEDGGALAWMGVKDKSYEVKADGTWAWIMGSYKDINDVRANWTVQGSANHPSVQPKLWFTGMTDPNEKYLTEERDRLVKEGAKPFPSMKYSEEDTKTIATIKADIDPYVLQFLSKVTTGETSVDSGWKEYVATLNQMGLPQLMDIYTKAYAAATK